MEHAEIMHSASLAPIDRFNQYKRYAFFALSLLWPSQSRQKVVAKKIGMDCEDLDQVALAELWRCCLNFKGDNEAAFRGYVKKSIKFALLDLVRRNGSLIKYSDDIKERAEIIYFEKPAPENNRGGGEIDLYSLIDSGRSVENKVITKITLEEKLSVLKEKEKQIIIYKLAGLPRKEIESRGMTLQVQNHNIRTAYEKLGISRKVYNYKSKAVQA